MYKITPYKNIYFPSLVAQNLVKFQYLEHLSGKKGLYFA